MSDITSPAIPVPPRGRGRPPTTPLPGGDAVLEAIRTQWDVYVQYRNWADVYPQVADMEDVLVENINRARLACCTWKMIGEAMGQRGPGALTWWQRRMGITPQKRAPKPT